MSSLDTLITQAVNGVVSDDDIRAFCESERLTRNGLYNRLTIGIARRFLAKTMDYEDGDAALNTIFALMVADLSEGPELAQPAYAIYEAFDAGEYHHGDGLDPAEAHTAPMLREIFDAQQGQRDSDKVDG